MPIRRRLHSAARRGQSPPQSRLIFASCGQSPAVVHAIARPASVRPSRILKGPSRIERGTSRRRPSSVRHLRRRPLSAIVRRRLSRPPPSRLHLAPRIGALQTSVPSHPRPPRIGALQTSVASSRATDRALQTSAPSHPRPPRIGALQSACCADFAFTLTAIFIRRRCCRLLCFHL